MSKQTYYTVQATEREDMRQGRALTLTEARRAYRELVEAGRESVGGWGRRFPRIIKITVETKTITPPRRRRRGEEART